MHLSQPADGSLHQHRLTIVRFAKIAGGSLLVLTGAVWTLQGLGSSYAPTSFMTNAPQWVVIGLATIFVGVVVAARAIGRR